ncbi:MAG: malto-oligosyltrehalose synthase [Deltaproteobacteria bacterium]|nr:malto-oligosyltrehalose synthase [Deltaproteobacteria bacterium]
MTIPRATYRLQFHSGFRFNDALEIVDYLAQLGVSHVYASPVFQAREGSTHGYDAVDLNRVNPELGTEEDLEVLFDRIRKKKMGWLQDMVANHMAFHGNNPMLMDVLEHGPGSAYREFFDIEWDHPYESMNGRVLAPFLGSLSGRTLEDGEITLRYEPRGLTLHYYEHAFPVALSSYTDVFSHELGRLKRDLGEDHPVWIQLLGILYVLRTLDSLEDPEERTTQARFVKRSLWTLYRGEDAFRSFVDANLLAFNGEPGRPESFDRLEALLLKQHFRLSFWKVATEEINYRRFFNVNELICLRQEDRRVFDLTHGLVLRWLDQGKISGLRIDHIDGFYDPLAYLEALQERMNGSYLLVEKILQSDEALPDAFPVHGTTGYDFLNRVNELLCSSRHRKGLTRTYRRLTGRAGEAGTLVVEKKRLIIQREMAGEVDNLARTLKSLAAEDRFARDITMHGLKAALIEVLARFPVYRTYAREEGHDPADRSFVEHALSRAREGRPDLDGEFGFLETFLLLRNRDRMPEEKRAHLLHFVRKFQQVTGPLMAKGFEDTSLYVYNRFLSVNEVGGDLERIGRSPSSFHRFIRTRFRKWPHAMNATATHDNKRGEDVRARLNVLSELAGEWAGLVKVWSAANRRFKTRVHGEPAPDANDEYFLYQTLLGAWPLHDEEIPEFRERIHAYLIKAVREAKVHTAWIEPDSAYEEAFVSFFESLVEQGEDGTFLRTFLPFCRRVSRLGLINSLSQVLLKLTLPGVPDLYQGTDLWDFSLVDPDNRRPVDFERRRTLLDEMRKRDRSSPGKLMEELLQDPGDGRVKMYLVFKILSFRRRSPDLFDRGAYLPLSAAGSHRSRITAYARRLNNQWLLAAAPRLPAGFSLQDGWPLGEPSWNETRIKLPSGSPRRFRDLFSGRRLDMGSHLEMARATNRFPVVLLHAEA